MPTRWRDAIPRLRRLIVTHWPIKIAALLLAAVLWAATAAQEPTTGVIPVRLDVQPPDGRAIVGSLPEVEALYAGSGRELFKLRGQPPSIRQSIPDTVQGSTYTFALSTADLRMSLDADVTSRDVQPRFVTVQLDELAEHMVPVVSRVSVSADSGYALMGPLRVTPDSLLVRGPRERLDAITSLPTVPLRVTGLTGAFRRGVDLDTAGLGGVFLAQLQVEVSVGVVALDQRTFDAVPVSLPPEASWEIDPPTVAVTVRGLSVRLEALTADSLEVTLAEPAEDGRAALQVRLPRGLTATIVPDSVTARPRP